jgi:hypothetical protein
MAYSSYQVRLWADGEYQLEYVADRSMQLVERCPRKESVPADNAGSSTQASFNIPHGISAVYLDKRSVTHSAYPVFVDVFVVITHIPAFRYA